MKLHGHFRGWTAPSFVLLTFVATLTLTGCITDDEYSKAVTQFQQSASTLQQAYQTLVTNANLIEANNYIDEQAFEAKPINPADMAKTAVMTQDEIKLRASAIKALTDYTTALASLASGKPSTTVEANAKTASTSLKTLTTDATTAAAAPSSTSTTPNFASPISAAVAAIGEVITLIEKHKGEEEVKASLTKNEPAIKELYRMIAVESSGLYAREKTTVGGTGVRLFADYGKDIQAHADPAQILQLSDRIKQYEKDSAALAGTDPAPAIAGFQKAHDALVKAILAPKDQKKESIADLIAAVKSFAGDVTPLATDLQGLAKSI
jgi:hypothetical protein